MKMRNFKVTTALMSVIVSGLLLAGCGSSTDKDYSSFYKSFSVDLTNYTIEAACTTDMGGSMEISSTVIGEDAMQVTTNAQKGNGFITITSVSSEDFSMVEMSSNNDHESFYCQGNMYTDLQSGIINGKNLYQIIQKAISNSVYSEYQAETTVGDVVRVIYKTDGEDNGVIGESHYSVYLNADKNPILVELPCTINNYNYIVKLDLINMNTVQMERNNSQYTEKRDLQSYYVQLIDYANNYVFTTKIAEEPVIEEEVIEEAPIVEEPIVEEVEEVPVEESISEIDLMTVSSAKDIFIKLSFSDFVDEVEFVSPTGGSYKVSSGNVEIMKDSDSSLVAYYRIPNAEVGNWKLRCNSANNAIDWEVVTDNKIKINALYTSAIKDGILPVSADLVKDKKLDINYEYHLTIDDGNSICASSSGIVNVQDAAKYNISVMDLPAGTYRAHLRIDYMYDGQKYFNVISSNEFTKGE